MRVSTTLVSFSFLLLFVGSTLLAQSPRVPVNPGGTRPGPGGGGTPGFTGPAGGGAPTTGPTPTPGNPAPPTNPGGNGGGGGVAPPLGGIGGGGGALPGSRGGNGGGGRGPITPPFPPALRETLDSNSPVGPAGLPFPTDRWENWWILNRDRFLNLNSNFAARARLDSTSADEFLGDIEDAEPVNPAAFHRAELRARLTPLLNELLRDRSALVRGEAALALGKIGGSEDVPALRNLLRDSNASVRQSALLGLGLTASSEALTVLSGSLLSHSTQDRERVHAAIALGSLADEGALPPLVTMLERGGVHREVQAACLIALGSVPGDAAQRILREWAFRPHRAGDLRSVATLALGRVINAADLPKLARLLDDPEVHVRRSAALALGHFEYHTDLWERRDELRERLHKWSTLGRIDADSRKSLEAMIAQVEERATVLGRRLRMAEDFACKKLVAGMTGDADQMVRAFSAIALGRIGSPKARQALVRVSGKAARSSSLRSFHALALGIAKAEVGGGYLVNEMNRRSVDPSSRSAMAVALGLLGYLESGPLLERFATGGGQPSMRGFASISLGMMNHRDSLDALRGSLETGKAPEVRPDYALGMALMGDTSALEYLQSVALGRGSTTSRVQAVQALSNLRDLASARALIKVLSSGMKNTDLLKGNVLHALGRIVEKGDLPGLEPLSRDWNYLLPFPTVTVALMR